MPGLNLPLIAPGPVILVVGEFPFCMDTPVHREIFQKRCIPGILIRPGRSGFDLL